MTTTKKNIWIDTDPGLDDTLAIIWAVQLEDKLNWKIHGISTVNGNLSLPQINGNAMAILKHLSRTDIPIYNGAPIPLNQKTYNASYVHGTSLGPIQVQAIDKISDRKAPEALAECLENLDGKLNLVTLGPLTNIAIFLRLYPEYISQIESITLMGGGTYGNVSFYSEFNIYVDPEAAKIVFDSGIPLLISPLDISENYTYIKASEFDTYVSMSKNPWVKEILEYLLNKFHKGNPEAKIELYDPTAMVAAAYPELFETYTSPATVELLGETRGMTLFPIRNTFDKKLPDNVPTKILKSCDREQFLRILFEGM